MGNYPSWTSGTITTVSDPLNMRNAPNALATILVKIPIGASVQFRDCTTSGWYEVIYSSYQGYCSSAYIKASSSSGSSTIKAGDTVITIKQGVNFRFSASTVAGYHFQVATGTTMLVSDVETGDGYTWYKGTISSKVGYLRGDCVEKYTSGGTVPSGQKYVYVLANNTAVYVTPGGALTANRWPINRRAIVTVHDSTWYKTIYKGATAYIRQDACGAVSTSVHSAITDRMNFIALYEKGQTGAQYYDNGSGNFCHLFVDWLAKHAGLSSARVPNESGCGWGIVRWINKLGGIGSGFFFTTAAYKAHLKSGYPGATPDGLNAIASTLTPAETSFTPKIGDFVYFKWSGQATGDIRVNHVGWVYNVAGGKIYTWEGNSTGGAVDKQEYTIGDSRIVGYGRPTYS